METTTSITLRPETERRPSLPNVFSSVSVSDSGPLWRRALGFVGPGFLVAVGYMDPGNWATDLAAGSRYGYTLLFVIMAIRFEAMMTNSKVYPYFDPAARSVAQFPGSM